MRILGRGLHSNCPAGRPCLVHQHRTDHTATTTASQKAAPAHILTSEQSTNVPGLERVYRSHRGAWRPNERTKNRTSPVQTNITLTAAQRSSLAVSSIIALIGLGSTYSDCTRKAHASPGDDGRSGDRMEADSALRGLARGKGDSSDLPGPGLVPLRGSHRSQLRRPSASWLTSLSASIYMKSDPLNPLLAK